jgi:serine/threonine protein phosphatase PrpC
MAVVCDGHGGERYFRSDIGSKFAAEATEETISFFVENVGDSLFKDKPFTAVGPASTVSDARDLSKVDTAFRQLFSSIIYRWNEKIKHHAQTVELTDWEKKHVPQKYLDEFAEGDSLEKQYGCTLMVYVQTPDYWFAFHIGDGKCLSFQESPIWSEPIPWDEKCFLNKTTSLCDTSAIEEFRYCYQGDGHFPTAIILGSDGLDDSMGETSNLANFYIQILKMLANEGQEATEASLKETLPQLSKIGSKDDMSVACVYDEEALSAQVVKFIQYQIDLVVTSIREADAHIEAAEKKLAPLSVLKILDKKSQIEIQYAKQDIEKYNDERTKLLFKHDSLMGQLSVSLSKNMK